MSTVHEHKKRFTLIELLAVIAVGILLTALAVPAFRSMTRENYVSECAGNLKKVLSRARVRAVNERCYVAAILPNGVVSEGLKEYRLGGCRCAYVEKTVSGEYTFSKWLDPEWVKAPAGALLSQVGSSEFVSDGGDITGCTLKISDALAGAAACLGKVGAIRGDDGSTALDAGEYCALIFTPQGSVVGSGKCYLLISEARVADDDSIVYPTAFTVGAGRSANNIVLKLNKLTGIVEYDK